MASWTAIFNLFTKKITNRPHIYMEITLFVCTCSGSSERLLVIYCDEDPKNPLRIQRIPLYNKTTTTKLISVNYSTEMIYHWMLSLPSCFNNNNCFNRFFPENYHRDLLQQNTDNFPNMSLFWLNASICCRWYLPSHFCTKPQGDAQLHVSWILRR